MVKIGFSKKGESCEAEKGKNEFVTLNLEPGSLQRTIESDNKLLESLLGSQSHISCRMLTRDWDAALSGVTADVRDQTGEVIMHVPFFRRRKIYNEPGTLTFEDLSGNVLLVCRQRGSDIAVFGAGGSHLGNMTEKAGGDAANPSYHLWIEGTTMSAYIGGAYPEMVYCEANGLTITKPDRSSWWTEDLINLSFDHQFDPNAKAMMIAGSYYLNDWITDNNVSKCSRCCDRCVDYMTIPILILIVLALMFGFYCSGVPNSVCGPIRATNHTSQLGRHARWEAYERQME